MTNTELAQANPSERSAYFRAAAADLQLLPTIVEKDFWVCWLLGTIFTYSDAKHFTFKGGTSLSKAFKAIDRFSEDVDISIDRNLLGYPDNAYFIEGSGNERKRRRQKLRDATQAYLADSMLPLLRATVQKSGIDEDAHFELDTDDGNRIVFVYPSSGIGGTAYLNDWIVIDGGFGDGFPRHIRAISPYVAQVVRTNLSGRIEIPVLDSERSFWEKATILHDLAHRPDAGIPQRYSRHYYDVAAMINGDIGISAQSRPDILADVLDFKNTYYPRPAARLIRASRATQPFRNPRKRPVNFVQTYATSLLARSNGSG